MVSSPSLDVHRQWTMTEKQFRCDGQTSDCNASWFDYIGLSLCECVQKQRINHLNN